MSSSAPSSDRDAILQQARALRAARRVGAALALLRQLQIQHPKFSRLYQEMAHCQILLGQAPEAVEALNQAVALNPALPACWDMLEQLHRMAGDAQRQAQAARHLSALEQLAPEVVVANSLVADGDWAPAETALREYLRRDAGNEGALRLLARTRYEQGAPQEAEAILNALLQRAPDYHAARLDYAMALLQQRKHRAAQAEAVRLLKYAPRNREYLKQYAAACIGLGDYEPIVELYEDLLGESDLPPSEIAELRLWRGNALKVIGRRDEAIADYRAALCALPDYGVAWFSLANLKTYRFSIDEIERMRVAVDRRDMPQIERVYLCFALGKAFEDHGDYPSSWRFYEAANRARRLTSSYRPDVAEACVRNLKRVFTADVLTKRAGWGADDCAPIFVLGLPRSGSTLIEQILASHSHVEGTQELTEIDRIAGDLCGQDPDCGLPLNAAALSDLTAEQARALGERYLSETKAHRRADRPYFIDKMPNNFWHIGLIQLILPRAKIIDVRREPMACCFSNFKQLFGTRNQEFTYGVEDMARHYRAYLEMMRHWDRVIPGRVLRVHYEDLVEDLEGGVRRVLSHCGLPFESACLAFHETRRSVRTPSSEQVRQPLGREGLTQWRHYEPWLLPLQRALAGALNDYRD